MSRKSRSTPTFPLLTLATLLVATTPNSAHADVGETYGFGSRSAALAGAMVAGPGDAFGAYSNPAKLSAKSSVNGSANESASESKATDAQSATRWNFGYSIIYMQDSFTDISNITVQNTYTSDATQTGNVDNGYPATFGDALGLSYEILPDFLHTTLGVVAFLPFNQLATMDTGETFIPEYVLFRARTQRPQVELGASAELGGGLHLGLGAHMAFNLSSGAEVDLKSNYGPSTMRFASTLKPEVAPVIGLYYESLYSKLTAGLVVRAPVASNATINLTTNAQVTGFSPSIPLSFTALSALYYDPLTVSLGTSGKLSTHGRAYAEVDYERWSVFQSPAIVVTNPQWFGGSGTTQLNPGVGVTYPLRDTFVPRLAYEYEASETTTLRAGYVFHPGIFSALPTGAGNYLDPDKHMLSVGTGFLLNHFLGGSHAWNVDLHLACEYLVTQNITKTAGDEAGNLTDPNSGNPTQKVGSPGYSAGGWVYGGGASVTVAF